MIGKTGTIADAQRELAALRSLAQEYFAARAAFHDAVMAPDCAGEVVTAALQRAAQAERSLREACEVP